MLEAAVGRLPQGPEIFIFTAEEAGSISAWNEILKRPELGARSCHPKRGQRVPLGALAQTRGTSGYDSRSKTLNVICQGCLFSFPITLLLFFRPYNTSGHYLVFPSPLIHAWKNCQ